MRLRALRVCDVRGFAAPGKAIESFGDGLNVLAAENEFGKSTLFDALRVVLFEKYTSSKTIIESLRPYQATGGPMVEVDLEIDGVTYRLRKRFLTRKMASVIDIAKGQTIASGNEVHDWVVGALGAEKSEDGPTGLLWVEQDNSLTPPSANEKSAAILSNLLEGAVSDVTGGAKLRAVLSAAKTDLGKLITEKSKKPTGLFRDALSARDGAAERVRDLEGRLAVLEAKRVKLSELQTELVGYDDPVPLKKRQSALKTVNEKLASASQIRARLEGLKNEVRLGEQAVATTKDALNTFEKKRQALAANQQKSRKIRDALQSLAADLKTKKVERDDLSTALTKQKGEVERAKAGLSVAREAEKARALQARLRVFDEQITNAEACHARLAASRSVQDKIAIDRKAFDQLNALSRTKDRAEAVRNARAITVSVQYQKDTTNKVHRSGAPLGDQERIAITDRVELELDEIGRMVIESGAGDHDTTPDDAAGEASQAFAVALEELGFATLAEAQAALEEKSRAVLLTKTAQSELERLAPEGIAELKAAREKVVSVLATLSLDSLTYVGEEQAKSLIGDAECTLEELLKKMRESDQTLADINQKVREINFELRNLDQQVGEDQIALGKEESWPQKQIEYRAALDDAKSALAVAVEAQSQLNQQVQSLDQLTAEKQRLEAEQAKFESQSSSLKQQRDILVGQLSELDREGLGERLDEAHGALARAKSRVDVYASEKRALDMLISALESAESHSQRQFFAPVMRELRPLLQSVLPDAELNLATNFSPNEIVRDGLTEAFSTLSGGTKEQIAILTRLAFARFMASKGRQMPVILDDALVYSDDHRISRMFDALGEAASDIQLIVLSCRQKTFEGLRGQRLQLIDWQSGK